MVVQDNFQVLIRCGDISYRDNDFEQAMDFFQRAADLELDEILRASRGK